jgi:hypothetical protein
MRTVLLTTFYPGTTTHPTSYPTKILPAAARMWTNYPKKPMPH